MAHRSDRFATTLATVFAVGVVAALLWRYRFSCDLTDETFSISLPYRFVRGDRPFLDEVSTAQTAGLILYPFVWLWVKVKGTTGLVLFVRHVHLAFKVLAAFAVWLAARKWLRSVSAAVIVSVTPIAFTPHSIPNVGYNALATALLVAGAFFSVAATSTVDDEKSRVKLLLASGAAYALATFAYPPVALAAILAGALLLVCAPSGTRLRSVGWLGAGAVLVLVVLAPALLRAGLSGIIGCFEFGASLVSRPRSKLLLVLTDWWTKGQPLLLGGYAAGVLLLLVRSRVLTMIVVPAGIWLAAVWFAAAPGALVAMHTVTWAGLLAPAMLLACRPDGPMLRMAALVVLPGWVAGHASAYASSNNTDNGAIGMLPATVGFVFFAVLALERARSERTWALVPGMLFSAFLVDRTYTFVYRDAPMAALTSLIPSGPFKGIWTTPANARFMGELESSIRRHNHPDGHILVLGEAPGAYLFSRMPPGGNTTWVFGWERELVAKWNTRRNGHGIVVRMQGAGAAPETTPPENLIEKHGQFSIFREP